MSLSNEVEKGHLADRRRHAPVSGRGGERIAPAHRRAKSHDAIRIDAQERTSEGNRGAPVFELASGVEQIWLAAAVAEPAMIEYERCEAACRKALRERAKPVAARARESVGHDDDRRMFPTADGRI